MAPAHGPHTVSPMRRFLFAALLAASSAQAQDAAPAPPAVVGRSGDVTLSLNGGFWPVGGGARAYVADRVAVGVEVDRAVFEDADPSTRSNPFVSSGGRGFTASAALERERPVARWLSVGQGVEVYYQRQTSDVVTGYRAGFEPVIDRGGRRTVGVGVALTGRMEARVADPLRVGFSAGFLGLGARRVRGGTVAVDGQPVPLGPDESRTRVRFGGGSSRFYVGVRL